jgi:hypothetical protein
MSYRFTNTEKWSDSWFSNLKQIEMLLFIYLCDNCDIAGFIEVNYKRWANDLGSSIDTIEGACKGLARGLTFSSDADCLFIKNFLKHQKNLPLNENNKAHIGIMKRFQLYSQKFNIQDINEFIQAPSKGLPSPTCIGNGIGIDKGGVGEKEKTWRTDFNIYKKEVTEAWGTYRDDPLFISKLEYFHEDLNIVKSLDKAFDDFWGCEKGWEWKKKSKTINPDWKDTMKRSLDNTFNHVKKQKTYK